MTNRKDIPGKDRRILALFSFTFFCAIFQGGIQTRATEDLAAIEAAAEYHIGDKKNCCMQQVNLPSTVFSDYA
jgi:hypothetical protein